jgi:GrpB-like predicted nucleotidyltransferase (UPF0157 family)
VPQQLAGLLQAFGRAAPRKFSYDPIMQAIRIVDYRNDWPAAFAALRDRLWLCVGGLASAIEHVGSTSVPGLSGKDKIDIDIVSNQLTAVIDRLARIGYMHRGNLGIAGREVFEPPAEYYPHNLYLCTPGALSLRNHLTVRDHLRAHPGDAAAYADLKRRLAEQFPFDRSAYVAGKTDFILALLARYGFCEQELDSVRGDNVKVCSCLVEDFLGTEKPLEAATDTNKS